MYKRQKKRNLEESELLNKLPTMDKTTTCDNTCGEILESSSEEVKPILTFDNFLYYMSTVEEIPSDLTITIKIPSYLIPAITLSGEGIPTLNEETKEWGNYKTSATDSITCHYSNRLLNILKRRDVVLKRRSSNWRHSRFYCQYKCALKCCHLNVTFHSNLSTLSALLAVRSHEKCVKPTVTTPSKNSLTGGSEKKTKSFADSLEIIHNELNF